MDAIPVIIGFLEVAALALIGALILYLVYRVGYQIGFDTGVRSDARNFYRKDDRA